jgi:hypothetical protein
MDACATKARPLRDKGSRHGNKRERDCLLFRMAESKIARVVLNASLGCSHCAPPALSTRNVVARAS